MEERACRVSSSELGPTQLRGLSHAYVCCLCRFSALCSSWKTDACRTPDVHCRCHPRGSLGRSGCQIVLRTAESLHPRPLGKATKRWSLVEADTGIRQEPNAERWCLGATNYRP